MTEPLLDPPTDEQVQFLPLLESTGDVWTFGPGDRVLVRIGRPLTPEQAGEVRALLEARFPDVAFTVLEADDMLVYRDCGGD